MIAKIWLFVLLLGAGVGMMIIGFILVDRAHNEKPSKILVIPLLVCISMIIGSVIFLNTTESGQQIKKEHVSQNEVTYTITIYDTNGNVIEKHEAQQYRADDWSKNIKFWDVNGQLHDLYYSSGTVSITKNQEAMNEDRKD